MALRSKKKVIFIIVIIFLAVPVGFMAINKVAPVGWKLYGPVFATNGVAINGYDPVAYHTQNKALKGDAAYSVVWNGVFWYFASQENSERFRASPVNFAPKYGGYCAIAVSRGLTAKVNPEIWHIENGELFLFFSEEPKIDFVNKLNEGVVEQSESIWSSAYPL